MSRTARYTAQDIIDALRKTKGMAYLAAKELGCSHTTVYNYISKHPTVKAEFDYQRGELLDVAELKLREAVLAGEQWALQFALRLLGKDRGYSERTEITGAGGAQLRIELHWPEDDGDNPASAA